MVCWWGVVQILRKVVGGILAISKDMGGISDICRIIKDIGGNSVILAKIGGNPVNCRNYPFAGEFWELRSVA